MPFTPILAHGALGAFDEVIFISVAAIFLIMMGISWFISRRNAQAENAIIESDKEADKAITSELQAKQSTDHVTLE